MYYKEFRNMHEVHPEGESENGRYIIHYVDAKEPDLFSKVREPEYAGQLDQKVCVLRDTEKGEIVMSDSWMEQETNIDFVRRAKGHVLVGGLGLGMVLLAIQDKPEVESITVVEIDPELRDLILTNLQLNDKVRVVISDINDYQADRKFDVVYCDIWNDISSNNYEEMNDLSFKFREFGDVSHWRFDRTEEMYEENSYYGY